MRRFIATALTAILPTALVAEPAEQAGTAPIMAMGAYVPTDDMKGSEAFYRVLFDSDPVIGLPDFVAFGVAGGWFAIVSRSKYAPGAEAGSGAVPYLQSSDLEALRVRAMAAGGAVPEIIKEPGIQLLKITDPNGQLIEFFKLTGQ
ncbi:hypothetical protein MHM88_03490 [Epibacterium sp. MM17-32]|uniref:VOC family protein n=1 Tax=Epibacterium sp. MM17-32 TaxID=2917734 RepID=UPI001EF5DCEA|nr:hypothetical protein [Epibacterium sp. MM17-32]MCG7626853.1 hypothetical protein [Epibacterium sp. MM17-32]